MKEMYAEVWGPTQYAQCQNFTQPHLIYLVRGMLTLSFMNSKYKNKKHERVFSVILLLST